MRLARISYLLFWLGMAAAGGGCNLMPTFDRPRTDQYTDFKYRGLADSLAAAPVDTAWWRAFEDPTLNTLVAQVRRRNYDLRAARANYEQVQALSRVNRSFLLPEVNVSADASRTVISENAVQSFESNEFATYSLLGLVNYQPDLWGALRNRYRAAVMESEVARLEYDQLLLVLRAQAASTYLTIRRIDAQIALYDSTIVLRERSLEIATLNFEAGASDALDQARAETQLRTAQSQRWTFINERARLENDLAVLVGEEPAAFSVAEQPLDSLPPVLPSAVPSEVLTQRPDIWVALKTMEAENARVGVARANLFPNITLSANAGYQGRSLETVLAPQSFAWTLGGGLLQPLFNYGRNRATVAAARARYQQVSDLYQQSVLSAFQEVENQLANVYYLRQRYQRQQQTVAAANRTLDLARQRYEAGLVSYLEVVDAERTALLNQVDAVGIIGELYQSTVALRLALGGSWRTESSEGPR